MADEFTAQLRLPAQMKKGEVVEVKLKIAHPSKTGLQLNEDAKTPLERFSRAEPAEYIREVEIFYGSERVSLFEINSSTSDDPILAFKLKVDKEAPVRAVVTNHLRKTIEASGNVKFA